MKASKLEHPINNNKIYIKPTIQRIKLLPQEAVLGGCKASTTGLRNIGPNTCSIPLDCVTISTS